MDDDQYRVLPGSDTDSIRLLGRESYEPVHISREGHDAPVADLRPGYLVDTDIDWSGNAPTVDSLSVRRPTLYTYLPDIEPVFEVARDLWQETQAAGDGMGSCVTRNTDDVVNGAVYVFADSGPTSRFEEFRDGSRPLEPLLDRVNKGETAADHIAGCRKTIDAGLSCSTYIMPGLGGRDLSDRHAHETADVLTRIAPDYIRIRSLQIFPQTPLAAARDAGEFAEVDETGMVKEIRTLVENIDARTEILSDSASNLLNINGRLPDHRRMMLHQIDRFLALSEREKRLFSLRARLQAFEGQYGGISKDIYENLKPYLKNGGLDADAVPDDAADAIIARIKSKLMP